VQENRGGVKVRSVMTGDAQVTGQDSTVQYRIGQYSTGQGRTVQDRIGQYRIGQDRIGQDRTVQYSTG
jgi:hypothetical protein